MTYPDHQGGIGLLLHTGRKLNSVWNPRDSVGHLLELTCPAVKVNRVNNQKKAGQLRIQEWRFESFLQAKNPKQLRSGLRREISEMGKKESIYPSTACASWQKRVLFAYNIYRFICRSYFFFSFFAFYFI